MWRRYGWWVLLMVSMAAASGLQDCSLEIKEQGISGGKGVYAIDARTVLQTLGQTNTQIFTPQVTTPEASPVNLPPVQWRQADYYRIAQAFHEFVWHEPMESWKLGEVLFRLDCEYAPIGPQFAGFTIFKTVRIREADSRLERNINIEPRGNQITWTQIEYYPERLHWSSFSLSEIKIPAQQALWIAESTGGRESRLAVENKCVVYEQLAAGVRDNDWLISYSGKEDTPLFQVNVDKQTGEYEIIYPKAK